MQTGRGLSRRELFRGPKPSPIQISENCLARSGIVCQSCGDTCPEAAISFRPRLRATALPAVGADRCTSCGECVAACPVGAMALADMEEPADA